MRILLTLCGILIIAGCSGSMVSLWETELNHPVQDTNSREQVRESILEGAKNAGWETADLSDTTILATYQIKIHTVHVSIYYSEKYYRPKYKSSIAMKMYCTEWEKNKRKYLVSGIKNCPGDRPPYYINANYKIWIDSLVAAIENSLSTK